MNLDLEALPTPCILCDEAALACNVDILARVQEQAGCRVLLALKGFAMFAVFPLIRDRLAGASVGALYETELAAERFGGELHVYAPAFRAHEFGRIAQLADHVVFNSPGQWQRFAAPARAAGCTVGVRLNPEFSEVTPAIYNPCTRHSRLGMTAEVFARSHFADLDGVLFHTHCEQGVPSLERTLAHIEARFAALLYRVDRVNLGGGQQITSPGYDTDRLVRLLLDLAARHDVTVYLEPSAAVAFDCGILVASVLDITENGMPITILDTSATAHMPDVLEMPYRPEVVDAGRPGQLPHTYRLAGNTCLAGDVIGDYSFDRPLRIGQKLVFRDMAHYTMVKNNTFNGIPLPDIGVWNRETGQWRLVRRFDYQDYRGRLS